MAGAFLLFLGLGTLVHGREFFCAGGDIGCLFAAITEAKFNGEANTIFLDNGTYTGLQLPSITGPFPITILGEDPDRTIISGAGQSLSNVFFIAAEGNLTLDGLTVTGAIQASGIRNLGTLTISNVGVRSNTNFFFGGGISNSGAANIFNSTISDNFSVEFSGGGIHNPGFMTITDSTIVNNAGGGANTSGNGVQNSGTLRIANTTIARNSRPAEVRGGGIENLGLLEITNSTISENRGTSGGGIANLGTAELRNTILAGNAGLSQGTSQVFAPGGADCAGTLVSLGNNVIGDLRDCDINLQPTDVTGSPGLAEYTENTSIPGSGHYPLLPESAAIDAANSEGCTETDQLGNPRVGICDIGSVEFTGASAGKLLVDIDARPRGDATRINPSSTKYINVAVFSGNGFDATAIDPNTIRFGVSGTEAAPVHAARRDANKDKSPDLIVRFRIRDLGVHCGDTSLTLAGLVADGQSFSGSMSITTKCKQRERPVSLGWQ
jgi:hypothetical protein